MNYVVVTIYGTVVFLLLMKWVLDLNFYCKNGWNFEIPHSGYEVSFSGVEGDTSNPLSNRTRVLVVMPIVIVLSLIFLAVLLMVPSILEV